MGACKKDRVVEQLATLLQRKGWRMACAESCTGGWVAKTCTDLAGSSAWFDRAYVSYSDVAKVDMLHVKPATLRRHGAVSEAVARQMAQGALRSARVDAALAVTGIAGPDGGSVEKPVGTVWFAWAVRDQKTEAECVQFAGDREAVRRQSVMHALQGLVHRLGTFTG
jgi:nicotinamide-nucleotide amidase